MQLRSLKWKGLPMWPPEWSAQTHDDDEGGVLEAVSLHVDLKYIVIRVNDSGDTRRGVMLLDNPDHLATLYLKLEENIGKPLAEVGDLDINLQLIHE
jgi:hypothetical protein